MRQSQALREMNMVKVAFIGLGSWVTRQLLDPEFRLDLLRPIGKQFRQPRHIASRLGGPGADCLPGPADLLNDQICTADAGSSSAAH